MYLIWSNEHGAWWRPARRGYTTILQSAGHYSRDEAISICANARDGWNAHAAPSEIPVLLADVLECEAIDHAKLQQLAKQ